MNESHLVLSSALVIWCLCRAPHLHIKDVKGLLVSAACLRRESGAEAALEEKRNLPEEKKGFDNSKQDLERVGPKVSICVIRYNQMEKEYCQLLLQFIKVLNILVPFQIFFQLPLTFICLEESLSTAKSLRAFRFYTPSISHKYSCWFWFKTRSYMQQCQLLWHSLPRRILNND